MNPKPLTLAGLATVLCLGATAASAHHSFAMFDQAQTLVFKGTITNFQWSNPHAVIWVANDAKPAASDVWTIELTSPGNLTRMGWTRHALNVGDKVSVEINPLRDGQHGGSLKKITIAATGAVLTSSLIIPGKQ